MLTDRVASLLPNTTAGACIPTSPWSSREVIHYPSWACLLIRTCHYSCHGATVCGAWTSDTCWSD
jgi:hypothetical protein